MGRRAVSVFELCLAGILTLLGVRSLVVWLRRDFEPASLKERLIYVLHVFARVGLWFAFAALFIGYATIDQVDRFRWFILLPISLSAMQLIGGVFLGRPSSDRTADRSTDGPADR